MKHFVSHFHMVPGKRMVVPTKKGSGDSRLPVTGADYVLDLGPVHWGAYYLPAAWLRYRVMVGCSAGLIDARTGKVLAKGGMGGAPSQRSSGISHSDVIENRNGILTKEVNQGAREIIAHLTGNVFGN